MITLADRVRTAAEATAQEITPDSIPDWSDFAMRADSGRERGTGSLRWHGRSRWLAPVASALAVLGVIVASIAIAAGGRPGDASQSTIALGVPAPGRGVPSYYVAIMQPTRKVITTVRNTRSGTVLATVKPPRGYVFSDAAAVPGYDSFVLAAQPVQPPQSDPERLYLLRFTPATRNTTLIRLPIPAIPYPAGLAVSPGGTELVAGSAGPNGSQLRIYSLSGRLIRQWQGPGTICNDEDSALCPSWAAGYLAFGWVDADDSPYGGTNTAPVTGQAGDAGVRLIRATAASGSLIGASRLAVPFKIPSFANFVLSGDGKTIATDVSIRSRGKVYDVYEEFSAATGKRTGQYWRSEVNAIGGVFWSNPTGSTLVVREPFGPNVNPLHVAWPLGTLTGGRFTPLPTPVGPWIAFAF